MENFKVDRKFLLNGEPTLLLDKEKCVSNIEIMSEKVERLDLDLRPHFKTHQSHRISDWFRNAGINKITVSSLKMAEYFAEYGWDDITVAFPVNIHEMEKINRLSEKIKLNLLIESVKAIDFLSKNLKNPVNIFIKIDSGYHRTGVCPENITYLKQLAGKISGSKLMKFSGFLTHAGHSYDVSGEKKIKEVQDDVLKTARILRSSFASDFPDMIISSGDTPTCSVAENFEGIDEIRPGNFVFFDLMQAVIGSCTKDKIAVAVAVPVVAKHKQRNELVVYGGAVHFSKDFIRDQNNNPVYGQLVNFTGRGWDFPEKNFYLRSLSQEHGILKVDDEYFESTQIGDILAVIPVHSCLTANLMKNYFTLDSEIIERL